MLKITELSEADINLRSIGFRSKEKYAGSVLWSIIRGEIIKRDNGSCRKIGCDHRASNVGHVNVDVGALIGFPYNLFSLCNECYRKTQISCPPLSELRSLNLTFFYVSGIRKIKGKENREIGRFYAEQRNSPENVVCYQLIRDQVFSLPPEYRKIQETWIAKEKEKAEKERALQR